MRLAAAILIVAAAAGCANAPAPKINILDARIDREHRPTYMGLPLKTGQVIVSEAPGAYSFFFALGCEEYRDFTHAGLIVMEDGEPFVYDVSGRYKPGIQDRPTDGIVGGTRRTPLMAYCAPNLYAEIYEPPAGVDREKVAAWVRERHVQGIVFDAYFRYDEHEKLFCSEFVALALEAGGARPIPLARVRRNPSLHVAIRYLAVPDDLTLPAALFTDSARYAGAIGIFPSRTQAMLYFAAKREVHRRFTEDQKLGNVFENRAGELILRPWIDEFLVEAVKLFPGARVAPSPAAISTAVRDLADETWGPLPEPAVAPAPGVRPASTG